MQYWYWEMIPCYIEITLKHNIFQEIACLIQDLQVAGVDILQKKAKNALRGKNSAPAKFPQPSKMSKIKWF